MTIFWRGRALTPRRKRRNERRPYVYPGTLIPKNKLGIRDERLLDLHERELVINRIAEGAPTGDFDLKHLQAIHRHLFQDIYDWAGQIRTVEISKDGHRFQFRKYIETGLADVHRRILARDYLTDLSGGGFAEAAAEIIGGVNYVHPFREGNGRTQLLYLKQLAARAGHAIDLKKLSPAAWLEASRRAHQLDHDPMAQAIKGALSISLQKEQNRRSPKMRR